MKQLIQELNLSLYFLDFLVTYLLLLPLIWGFISDKSYIFSSDPNSAFLSTPITFFCFLESN